MLSCHENKNEQKTINGIIIPDREEEDDAHWKVKKAEVVAVSEQIKDVKINDIVLINKYAGDNILVNGVEYKVINPKIVLAVLEEGEI